MSRIPRPLLIGDDIDIEIGFRLANAIASAVYAPVPHLVTFHKTFPTSPALQAIEPKEIPVE